MRKIAVYFEKTPDDYVGEVSVTIKAKDSQQCLAEDVLELLLEGRKVDWLNDIGIEVCRDDLQPVEICRV